MNLFETAWADIRRGENIDLYATVLIAFGLVVLVVLGLAPAAWIATLTLAVLGLLAITSLGNRYRVEEMLTKLEESGGLLLQEFPSGFRDHIESAEEICLERCPRCQYSHVTGLEHYGQVSHGH